jgi:hypothetical protein
LATPLPLAAFDTMTPITVDFFAAAARVETACP